MRRSRIPPLAKLLLLIGGLVALYGGAFMGQLYRMQSYDLQALTPVAPPAPLADLVWQDLGGQTLDGALTDRWTLLFATRAPGDWQGPAALGLRIRNRLADDGELQRAFRLLLVDLDAVPGTPGTAVPPARFNGAIIEAKTDGTALQARLGALAGQGPILIDPDGRALGRFTEGAEPATIAADIHHLKLVRDQEHP